MGLDPQRQTVLVPKSVCRSTAKETVLNTQVQLNDSLIEANSLVYVVDDDAPVREAIAGLLASVGIAVESYSSALALLHRLKALELDATHMPNCLIVDVRMPGVGGLELQQYLASAGIRVPIIFVTGHGDVEMTVQAMKAGARDFLSKPFRDQHLIDAVRSALVHDRTNRESLRMQRDLRTRYESLTAREQKVLALVARGLMNKQIASELNLSEITIKVHRRQLMTKMKAKSFAELVKMEERIQTCR
jgi:FixJ family two-component response regulator